MPKVTLKSQRKFKKNIIMTLIPQTHMVVLYLVGNFFATKKGTLTMITTITTRDVYSCCSCLF